MEKEILENGHCLLREKNEVKYGFIKGISTGFIAIILCQTYRQIFKAKRSGRHAMY